MANILAVDVDAIRNIMDQGANTVMIVRMTKIAVHRESVLIYMEPLCRDANAIATSDGLDQIAAKVRFFIARLKLYHNHSMLLELYFSFIDNMIHLNH